MNETRTCHVRSKSRRARHWIRELPFSRFFDMYCTCAARLRLFINICFVGAVTNVFSENNVALSFARQFSQFVTT